MRNGAILSDRPVLRLTEPRCSARPVHWHSALALAVAHVVIAS